MSRALRHRLSIVAQVWGVPLPCPNAGEAGAMLWLLAGAVLRGAPVHSGSWEETEDWRRRLPTFLADSASALLVALAGSAAQRLHLSGEGTALRERFEILPAMYRLALRDPGLPAMTGEVQRLAWTLAEIPAENLPMLNLR